MSDDASGARDAIDPDDPFLTDIVERAAARHAGRLSPEALDEHRQFLTFLLATHPAAKELVRRARAEAEQQGSGVVARRDPAALDEAARRRRAGTRRPGAA